MKIKTIQYTHTKKGKAKIVVFTLGMFKAVLKPENLVAIHFVGNVRLSMEIEQTKSFGEKIIVFHTIRFGYKIVVALIYQ